MSHNKIKNQPNNPIPDELPPAIKEILKVIPDKERPQILKKIEFLCYESYQGMLPHPKHLAEYNEIIPNGADRILALAEKQSAHRIESESKVISGQMHQSSVGQWMAFALTIIAFGLTCFLAINGHDAVAGTIAGTTIVGLATTFIYGKKGQKKELRDKAE